MLSMCILLPRNPVVNFLLMRVISLPHSPERIGFVILEFYVWHFFSWGIPTFSIYNNVVRVNCANLKKKKSGLVPITGLRFYLVQMGEVGWGGRTCLQTLAEYFSPRFYSIVSSEQDAFLLLFRLSFLCLLFKNSSCFGG